LKQAAMRKLVMFNLISQDGFFAGLEGEIGWYIVDNEFDRAAVEMIKAMTTPVSYAPKH
jgi:hypothetical protein